ncbi:hypothetical protein K438DRAFT_404896 [Mycena galopus ATCC 62051]|nr:hypothetical protein K438DRAFT_404896 [Mycena galopus ATCC 62051]
MFYGWLLEPELFGPGTITLRFDDGRTTTFKRPITAKQAHDTFEFVAIALRLLDGICIEPSTDKRPRIASFAEAVKNVGVRSRLNDGDKMPPAAMIQKLEETLHLLKKPEWIQTTRWSTPNEAMERAFNASVPPLIFSPSLRPTYTLTPSFLALSHAAHPFRPDVRPILSVSRDIASTSEALISCPSGNLSPPHDQNPCAESSLHIVLALTNFPDLRPRKYDGLLGVTVYPDEAHSLRKNQHQ